MGIPKRWTKITPRSLGNVPDEPGAYEIADTFRRTIDIGGSEILAERLPRKVRDPKFRGQAIYFRYIEDGDPWAAEAELQADFISQHGEPPRFTYRVQGAAYDLLEDGEY